MRTIILGGVPVPIKATAGTIAANTSRLSAVLIEADMEAEAEAEKQDLSVDQFQKLKEQKRKKANRIFMADAENSLKVIADMVNAAVDSERVLHGHDIREQSPYYPASAEKLAFIISSKEMNDLHTAQVIAEEIAEATGSKNLTAGELVKMAQMVL